MIYNVENLQIHVEARKVFLDGRELSIAPKPFDLLVYLAEDPEEVYSYEDLMRDLWPMSESLDPTTNVRATISRLRQTLGDSRFLNNCHGRGVQLLASTHKEIAA